MDREEKSKQPITRFVRVRGEIRWGEGEEEKRLISLGHSHQ